MSLLRRILGVSKVGGGLFVEIGPTLVRWSAEINTNLRAVVRDSSGNIYVAVYRAGTLYIYESTNGGASFSQSPNASFLASFPYFSIAIDGSDVIHIIYREITTCIRYRTYNPSTDVLGAKETAYEGKNCSRTVIALDSNGIPHVAYMRYDTIKGTDYRRIFYSNRIGGVWSAEEQVDPAESEVDYYNPSIGMDGSDNVHIAFYDGDHGHLWYAKRTGVDTWARTEITVAMYNLRLHSLVVDSNDNPRITYIGADYDLWIAEFNGSWSTSEIAAGTFSFPALGTNGGTYLYVVVVDNTTDDIVLYKKENGAWSSQILLEAGTFNNPSVKWSYNWNNGAGSILDFIFYKPIASEYWWDKYEL